MNRGGSMLTCGGKPAVSKLAFSWRCSPIGGKRGRSASSHRAAVPSRSRVTYNEHAVPQVVVFSDALYARLAAW
jgi:hypothetical protein